MSSFLVKAESDSSTCGPEARQLVETIKQYFQQLDCHHFTHFIGTSQQAQKALVDAFQAEVMRGLHALTPLLTNWQAEKTIGGSKDKADLSTEVSLDGLVYNAIIEFDKPRADQVAKKFLSRTAHTLAKPTLYFAVCYTGTARMNGKEVEKYFSYCCAVSNKLSTSAALRAFVGLVLADTFATST